MKIRPPVVKYVNPHFLDLDTLINLPTGVILGRYLLVRRSRTRTSCRDLRPSCRNRGRECVLEWKRVDGVRRGCPDRADRVSHPTPSDQLTQSRGLIAYSSITCARVVHRLLVCRIKPRRRPL